MLTSSSDPSPSILTSGQRNNFKNTIHKISKTVEADNSAAPNPDQLISHKLPSIVRAD